MINRFIDDPLFFKRCLVVHVDLALVVWFYSFIAALVALKLPAVKTGPRQVGFHAAVIGVFAMLTGALMRGAQPILANYVPVIDHPLFLAGLALFFGGVVTLFVSALARGGVASARILPAAPSAGLWAAAVAVTLAAVTWIAAATGIPGGLDTTTYFEFTAWGAGHVLQVANACAMLAVWLWLAERATGEPVLSGSTAQMLFTALVAPHFAMPLLTARGTLDTLYHSGATQLMRWGIFPVVAVVLALTVRHLWRHRASLVTTEARALLTGFCASAALCVLGIALGACIRSSTTLVPAHYHASLGAVTVAFMTAAHLIADLVRSRGNTEQTPWRWARWQLPVFGIGQTIFALGFALGGAYGLGRKAYAAEQHVRTMGEYVGLFIMGAGGLIAMAGGLWFLGLMARKIRGWWTASRESRGTAQPILSR